ncbi:class I SAM-dependent methyltransferase [Bosea sp. TND4EK4]|uniref:class I SAM-dependent methyltransferase n=1 Tax=Bosea sp. TND4EK4 TaxID=1907408 RepID=UPI000956C400|nr:class I SAM-dependent methyltransferase [Bosea sp. TND4EK4]SIR20275.1 Methyltransferase domain-containing protein [Bosea sp. TND4EK4]
MINPNVAGGSPERFGYEWGRYSDIKPEYEEQFRRWLPFYESDDWRGKRFVDVGCGMGRNSYWPLSYGAAQGHALDVDARSLASARANLASFANCEVLESSAYELPWTSEIDIAFSIGVIHHLEFPERALAEMVRSVKAGGQIAIWVYGRENNGWLIWALNPARKLLFSRMPISLVHHLSLYPTAVLWLFLRMGLTPIKYFGLLRGFTFSHLRSIVFDQMLPKIANYWRKDEVEALMREAGLERIQLAWVNEMSWAARGFKRA